MRIEGMEAVNVNPIKPAEPVTSQQIKEPVVKAETQPVLDTYKPTGRYTEYEKRDLPVSEKLAIDAIEKANKAIVGSNRRFEFSIHEATKEIMVKVIDSDTNEVVREIPNEKILDMVAKMWEMAGIMVDERR